MSEISNVDYSTKIPNNVGLTEDRQVLRALPPQAFTDLPQLRREAMAMSQPQQFVNIELIEQKLYRALYSTRQLEEVLAQREHDALPNAREPANHGTREHPRGGVDAEVDDHVAREARDVAFLHPVVDRVLHEQQPHDGACRAEHRDHAEEGDAAPVPAQVAAEAAQACSTRLQGPRLRRAA